MCSECYQTPCPAGCPNAPAEKANCACEICGTLFYEDELTDGVCENCAVGKFSWELGKAFVRENPVAFFEWMHQISYRTNDNHGSLTAIFWKDMFGSWNSDWEEREALLRDYCLESGEARLSWVQFLKERR